MSERLRLDRCYTPFATVIETWDCHLLWEKTAIDSVTRGCEKIHTEVFRAKDIAVIRKNCELFFALMPTQNELLR